MTFTAEELHQLWTAANTQEGFPAPQADFSRAVPPVRRKWERFAGLLNAALEEGGPVLATVEELQQLLRKFPSPAGSRWGNLTYGLDDLDFDDFIRDLAAALAGKVPAENPDLTEELETRLRDAVGRLTLRNIAWQNLRRYAEMLAAGAAWSAERQAYQVVLNRMTEEERAGRAAGKAAQEADSKLVLRLVEEGKLGPEDDEEGDTFPVVCANGCPEGWLGRHKFSCSLARARVAEDSAPKDHVLVKHWHDTGGVQEVHGPFTKARAGWLRSLIGDSTEAWTMVQLKPEQGEQVT